MILNYAGIAVFASSGVTVGVRKGFCRRHVKPDPGAATEF
jgi:hypothetical protein